MHTQEETGSAEEYPGMEFLSTIGRAKGMEPDLPQKPGSLQFIMLAHG